MIDISKPILEYKTNTATHTELNLSTFLHKRKEVIKIRLVKKSPIKFNGGYTQLWIAVINQAVNDYRNYPEMRSEVERFFKSIYFEKMTGINGEVILNRLKKR